MNKIYNDKLLKVFMLIQPIIDIITSIMINEFHLSLSLGMVLRFLFLVYALGYIFINRNKKIILYSIVWLIYCVISLVGNTIIKADFNVFTQLTLLLKLVYFPFILLFWVLYFKQNKELDKKWFIYIGLLVGTSLVISALTKTAYCTYSSYEDCYEKGIVAWFNSANEYGLILIALLGLILMDYLKKTNLNNILALLLVIVFLCILGTKASYIGVIGVISCYVVYFLLSLLMNYKRSKNFFKVISLLIILFIIGLSTSNLPIYTNLVDNYSRAYSEAVTNDLEKCDDNVCETPIKDGTLKNDKPSNSNKKDNNVSAKQEVTEEIKDEITSTMVFNGRDDFVKANKSIYKDSKMFNKFFGITTQGNYYEGELYTHINERDLHDLLIYYGIIGFIMELILPTYLLIDIFKKIKKDVKILLEDEIIITGIVVTFILIGSYIAGHCLFQPAVSIYLAYLIAIFYKKVMEMK